MNDDVTIRMEDVRLWGHCGVTPAEREVGQLLRLDLRLVLVQTDATATDDLNDTVNYGEVVRLVKSCVASTSFALIERLAGEVVEELWAAYDLRELSVTVTKLAPPVGFAVGGATVEVVRRA